MKSLARIAAATLLTALAAPAGAAEPAPPAPGVTVPPALFVPGPADRAVPLRLTAVDVDARVVGHLAETRMTMTFANDNDRALAGDLYFPLPEGATISGYALDVNGAMVDGVVIDKDRARQVFEAEVRKGVDPGLVEWTRGNSFKTRVFPIPARGSRTVSVAWVAPLDTVDGAALYRLPLRFAAPVDAFHARLEVVKAEGAPVITGGGLGARFGKWRDAFVAEATLKAAKLTEDLVVRIPDTGARPARAETAADGQTYVMLRATAQRSAHAERLFVKRARIVWDASRSREGDHGREIALLERWLSSLQGEVEVDLDVVRDAAEPTRTFSGAGSWAALIATLRALPYDGGTQLGAMAAPHAGRYDAVLVFSDGLSNFGAGAPEDLGGPVYAINAAAVASHETLRFLARASGGAYVNLARVDDATALAALGRPVFSFLGATVVRGEVADIYPRLPEPALGPTDISAVLKSDEAELELRWGHGASVETTQRVVLRRDDAGAGELLRRQWAQAKVRDLLAFPDANAEAIAAVGKAHGVVTPNTSLLVLERLDQYVEHDVRPPASLAKMRAEWDRLAAAKKRDEAASQRDKLAEVLKLWEDRVAWWEKDFDYPKGFRYTNPDRPKADSFADGDGAPAMEEAPRLRAAAPPRPSDAELEADDAAPALKKEKKKSGDDGDASVQAAIVLTRWDPKTPYLEALKKAPAAKRYEVYLAQRATYGTSPAFFLDCSDFFRPHDAALAMRILSNIAELELEEPALLRVLAHRLAQIDALDLAAGLFTEVLKLRPEEPQSYRDLALVLARRAEREGATAKARRADYARALELLAEVVMGHWDRFAEIELMALTEANRVWPLAKAAGVDAWPLDPRLNKRLDFDVRIVMTWDADMTDMDLHVIEPSGEEAYYSHNRTTIGGLVSRDFTQGYGPEVYLLRRGMHGSYKIRSKFFGSSAAELIGAVTLQVEVFTNYGRKDEQRRTLTFRLTERKESLELGEIEL